MPALNVQSSIEIAASVGQVRKVLVDFRTWPVWSPWLYLEPDTPVTYRGDAGKSGHGYDWEGDKIGAGGMTLVDSTDERINCDLQFLKPFKSSASVRFDLQSIAPVNTRVTWLMDSSLPFFMFWMKADMAGMIRSDYRRGLLMLKDYIENRSVSSNSEVMGHATVDELAYAGLQTTAAFTELSASMEKAYGELFSHCRENASDVQGNPFCIYNKMDMKQDMCTYTVALPVSKNVPVNAPFLSTVRPECTAYKVVHTGAYRHLGNAWSMLMSEAKHHKLKVNKSLPPFERYLNDPDSVDEHSLITELYLPLK